MDHLVKKGIYKGKLKSWLRLNIFMNILKFGMVSIGKHLLASQTVHFLRAFSHFLEVNLSCNLPQILFFLSPRTIEQKKGIN